MKNLITSHNLTFTKKKCNCGIKKQFNKKNITKKYNSNKNKLYLHKGGSICNLFKTSEVKQNVLIIGMGPVGLLTAIKLAEKNKFNITIIEKRDTFSRNQVILIQPTLLKIIGKEILQEIRKYSCRILRPPPMLGDGKISKRPTIEETDQKDWSSLPTISMCKDITDIEFDTIFVEGTSTSFFFSIPLNILQKILYNYIVKKYNDIQLIFNDNVNNTESYVTKSNYIIFTSSFSIHKSNDKIYKTYCINETTNTNIAEDYEIPETEWCADSITCNNMAIIQDGTLNQNVYKSPPNDYLKDTLSNIAIKVANPSSGPQLIPPVFQHERRMFLRKSITDTNTILSNNKPNINKTKYSKLSDNDRQFYIATVLPNIQKEPKSNKCSNTNINKSFANCMIKETLRRYGLEESDYDLNTESLHCFPITIRTIKKFIFDNLGKKIMFLGDALQTHHFFTGQGVNSGWRQMNLALTHIFGDTENRGEFEKEINHEKENTLNNLKFATKINNPEAFTTSYSQTCFQKIKDDYTTDKYYQI